MTSTYFQESLPVKVIIFGASGMMGQGVLRACLLDPAVVRVLVVVRRPLGISHPKLEEVVHQDFAALSAIAEQLAGHDACFYCLGASALGQSEAEYTRITYDYTLAAAHAVSTSNPGLTFTYISGEGTDSSEQGRTMWGRVKGRTENTLLGMPMRAYMFRPAYIRPSHGAASRTQAYRVLYASTSWLYPLLHRLAPRHTTTTEHIGRAMIAIARADVVEQRILYSPDINRLGGES
ncbi:Rossmann-fold NAD(P)-binding domain-containing protein [Rhodococcus globerulus]|uniref:Epimerase n=1 Tax=Rhodococcus globerulus TaxID=33008 RepID=A0ABU4C408_RHOGO|nr:epimerase [Rhodococcus globerulus]MDV6271231.1 epimerase [Rhodococcus globerulus]